MHSPRFVLLLDVRAERQLPCRLLSVHETPYFPGRIDVSCEMCVRSSPHTLPQLAHTTIQRASISHFPFHFSNCADGICHWPCPTLPSITIAYSTHLRPRYLGHMGESQTQGPQPIPHLHYSPLRICRPFPNERRRGSCLRDGTVQVAACTQHCSTTFCLSHPPQSVG
jgi:hypothetical protein